MSVYKLFNDLWLLFEFRWWNCLYLECKISNLIYMIEWVSLQMILYDTPGVIEKKMHKLDSMMMKNVRNAAVNADCVLVVVDASKMPQKVIFLSKKVFCGVKCLQFIFFYYLD